MPSNEEIISGFLQTAYTDEKLAALLAHAEDGKLAYWSCCCFAGIPTATHALQVQSHTYLHQLREHANHPDWDWDRRMGMSSAYAMLASSDSERRAKLIPLIHAEFERRQSLREPRQSTEDEEVIVVSALPQCVGA